MTDPDAPLQPPPARRRGELAFALVFLAVTLFFLSQIGTQARWFPRTQFAAQPAFWPMVSLSAMAVFAALYLVSLLFQPRPDTEWREYLVWLRAFEYVAWYMAYAALVGALGYLSATVLAMVLLVWRLGLRSGGALLAAAGFGLAVVVLFKTLLAVRIPGGAAYELLPATWRSFMITYF